MIEKLSEIIKINTFVAFDEEVNSVIKDEKELIAINALKYVNGTQIGKFHSLIKPSKPLSKDVETLTGITNAELDCCHHSAEDVLPIFDIFVGKNPVVCSNVSFVNEVFIKYKGLLPNYFSAEIIDIKDITESIFTAERYFTVSKMALFYNIDQEEQDLITVCRIFEMIKKLIAAIGSEEIKISKEQLIQIVRLEELSTLALQKRFNWGYSQAIRNIEYLKICGFIKNKGTGEL